LFHADLHALGDLLRRVLKLDPEEDAVELLVRDPEVALVRLPRPETRGRDLAEDLSWAH